jgi:hypothetical protein
MASASRVRRPTTPAPAVPELYAVVQDIPASWADYEALAGIAEPAPDGLVLHVAGPTDEGFRTIELWATREACERFHARSGPEHWSRNGCLAPPIPRTLATRATVRGRTTQITLVPEEGSP